MATHHGKEGVVKAGGTGIGELTGFTLETTADVVEDTQLSDATKSFVAGRTSFSGSLDMNYDETDSPQQTLTVGSEISLFYYQRVIHQEMKVLQGQELLQECQLLMVWTQSFQDQLHFKAQEH